MPKATCPKCKDAELEMIDTKNATIYICRNCGHVISLKK